MDGTKHLDETKWSETETPSLQNADKILDYNRRILSVVELCNTPMEDIAAGEISSHPVQYNIVDGMVLFVK